MKSLLCLLSFFAIFNINAAWLENSEGFWKVRFEPEKDPISGNYLLTPVFSAPEMTTGAAGARAEISRKITPDPNREAKIQLDYRDSYNDKRNGGYYTVYIKVNDRLLWECDAALDHDRSWTFDIPKKAYSGGGCELKIGVFNRRAVTNFPIDITLRNIVLKQGDKNVSLLDPAPADAGKLSVDLSQNGGEWTQDADSSGFWKVKFSGKYDARTDAYYQSPFFAAPGMTPCVAGAKTGISREVMLDPAQPARIVWTYSSHYNNQANNGYYTACVRVGDTLIKEFDAALDNDREWQFDIPRKAYAGSGRCRISISVLSRRTVSNFPINISWEGLAVTQGSRCIPLLPEFKGALAAVLPEEKPEPMLPPRGLDWTRTLRCVQAWAQPDFNLVKYADKMMPLLRDELRMNAICLRPPEVFNHHRRGLDAPGHRHTPIADYTISEAEFQHALEVYRRGGFKIFLYIGITNLGHCSYWDTGAVHREHPDWVQLGSNGDRVIKYSNPFLCPNTGATGYALEYAASLLKNYHPDALMFDNSFYHYANEHKQLTPTCYCPDCQAKFKTYIVARFGDDVEKLFGVKPERIVIPAQPGLLMNVWLDWRNISWGNALEKLRRNLPVPVIANTEIAMTDWILGIDRVFKHEDAVFFESSNLREFSSKMCLAAAYAPDRPVFNYLITFELAGERFWKLRPGCEIMELLGTTLGYKANMWLMFHGWDPKLGYPEPVGDANRPGQEIIKKFYRFNALHERWFADMRFASDIGIICSSRNRMYAGAGSYPAVLPALLRAGYPCRALYDLNLMDPDIFNGLKVIVAENIEFLSDGEVGRLMAFAAGGGVILATGNCGAMNQFGQLIGGSALFKKYLELKSQPGFHGRIIRIKTFDDIKTELRKLTEWEMPVVATDKAYTEIVPFKLPDGSVLLHGIAHSTPEGAGETRFTLPRAIAAGGEISLHSPLLEVPITVRYSDHKLTLPVKLPYFILEIPANLMEIPEKK